MLVTNELTRAYGSFVALDHLNMTIGDGELHGFVGPNGAGKTTTMRILATLLKPNSGTATLETALLGIPEVVVYRTVWWQVWLRPYVLKVPWVSLVNLNLGREAVAEIIQSDFSVDRAERELRAILHGGSKRGKMLADFGELKTIIGGPGASERFAARMVAELHAQKIK